MFGINRKLYYIISCLLYVAGLTLCIFSFTKVFGDDNLVRLSGIAIILLGLCVMLQPSSKKMKLLNKYIIKYRSSFYKELETLKYGFDSITLKENSDGFLYVDFKKRIICDDLSLDDAEYIFTKLIRDYVIIIYSVFENDKINMDKSKIEKFTIKYDFNSKEYREQNIIEDFKIVKMKHYF